MRFILFQEREDFTMSKPNKTEVPNIPCGPATGAASPEPKNEVLTKDSYYTGESTPGTTNYAHPEHAVGGPGHDGCNHN